MVRLFAALLIAGAAAAGFWFFTRESAGADYTFESAMVDTGAIERSVTATGSVSALITVAVSSQLSGKIADVKVDYNSPVKTNDLLAVIDQQTFAAQVASAEADLQTANATVQVQQANVVKSEALVQQARRDLERQRALLERNATPQATVDTAETTAATAEADLIVARAQLENARSVVAQKTADLQRAKIDLNRTEIRSPIDGVVIARAIDPGATVAASLSAPVMFSIAQDLSQIQILAQVDEADIGAVQEGNDVTFTVDAYPEQVFPGKVQQVRIAGTTTNNVVTYTVVVLAQNPRQKLLPGMTATVRIITGTRKDVLRVPNEAVRFRPPAGVKTTTNDIPRPNRDGAIVSDLTEALKLTPDQQEKLRTELAARRTESGRDQADGERQGSEQGERRGRQGGGGRGERGGDSAQNQGRVSRALAGILTPEQMQTFQTLRAERRETRRPAIIWLETASGLEPRRIRLGLTDDAFSEVLDGPVAAGDRVITRARSLAPRS